MIASPIILAWALYGIIGPVILTNRRNESGYHNALAVWMTPRWENNLHWGGTYWPALKVQEVGEWRLAKIAGVLAGLIALWPASMLAEPLHQIAAVGATMLLFDGLVRWVPGFDYAGHGAEIMVAEEVGFITYRADEITRMIEWDNRQHMTPEQVDAALKRWHWLARIVRALARADSNG